MGTVFRTSMWLAGLCALAAAIGAPTASAASNKPYSLVICALGSSETCTPSPSSSANSPAAVPVGATSVTMTATFTNENKPGSGIQLGSANLTPPAGFTVSSPSVAGCSSCASVSGNVVQLRGLGVSPGSSVAVTMTVDDSSAANCLVPNQLPKPTNSVCAWSAEVKQSNDFSGQPGNDLTLAAGASAPYTVLAHLQFGTEPHNVVLGQFITGNDYAPGPAVTVDITDANGTVDGSYVGPVTLALNTPLDVSNPTPGTLGGTNPENASSGVASFADLMVNLPADGYTLTASTADLPPDASSSAFDAQQSAAICAANASCATEATSPNWTTNDGGIDVKVNAAAGNSKSELAESVDFGNWPASIRDSECGGASLHFTYSNLTTARLETSSVTTTDTSLTKSKLNAAISSQEICLAQSNFFMAKDNSTNPPSLVPAQLVTLPDGTTGYAGLEPDCGSKSNQVPVGTGPCVTGRSGKVTGSGGGTLTITDSDPFDRYIN